MLSLNTTEETLSLNTNEGSAGKLELVSRLHHILDCITFVIAEMIKELHSLITTMIKAHKCYCVTFHYFILLITVQHYWH